MATPVSVYVFGDQTYDISSLLSTLLQAKRDPLLNDFLEKSLHALKRETKQLPPWQQTECPRFSKLADLLPYWRAGTLNPALGQAVTCLCQLGLFLLDHGCAGQAYPTNDNAVATGLCTGTLSAATVASASNASSLLPIAVYTVKVAFRVGACAWDVGSRLAELRSEDGRFQQWTAALHGLGEDDVKSALERFIATKAIPPVAGPYLSAHIGPKQFSVSGPPETLNALLAEPWLSKHVLTRLFITSPYHARHLYSRNDVDRILHDVDGFWTGPPSNAIKVVSTVTGQTLPSSPFPAVLRIAVEDCLQHGIRWDLATDGVATHIHSVGAHKFTICPVAASVDRLRPAIEKANLEGVENDASPTLSMNLGHPAAKSKIAVIGSSARLPQASDLNSFWDVLIRGIDTHEVVPAKRWNSRTHIGDAAQAKNVSGTGFGCWLHDAGQFDARFFNMSPREAPQVDPAQRLALLTAAEALDYAGVVPGRTSSTQKDRVGVYFGSTSNDWMETNSAQNIDTYFIPGGNRAFIPGRINYHFKFSGPSYTIDTACSSSLAAIHMACNALWRGEVDTAIVGGTNVLTNPDMTAGLDRGHFLSRTGNCKTFDESADGYCRGEGVATMILKRLPDAEADKDPIQACILGIATNHSAEADSITRPHVGAQQALFESLLADVGVHPHDISYVEMHGTGTQAGDAGETASVLETLAPAHGPLARPSTRPLYIGAAKANVGHGESVAGITSLAKILLMLKNSTIPPHCGIKTKLNSKIPDLVPRNTFIARKAIEWQKPQSAPRRVLLNNFSAAGGNTALVLEDAPDSAINGNSDPRQFHPVGLSAKTPISLEENIKSLMSWISDQDPDSPLVLPQLSYTTTARRNHHLHRVMVTGSDLDQIKTGLQEALDHKEGSTRPKSAPDFVFAFTGQGAHYAGMGSDLYSRFSNFRADVRRYDQLCLQLNLPSIRHLFENSSANANTTPTILQLSAVCFQMALFRLWTSFGVTPKAVVGHSLGEYPALYAAGVLSQADVLHLVGRRAQLMEMHCQQNSHAMLAVRSSLADIQEYLGPAGTDYEVTCANGRQSSVIGGTTTQINAVRPSLQRKGSSSTLLQVPYAFHTSQVDPILPALRALAQGTKFAQPSIPIISPACGKVVRDNADLGADYIVKHCRASVNMYEALTCAKEEGLINEQMMALEIGPSVVVSNMVKEVAGPGLQAFPTVKQGEDTWKLLSTAMIRFHTAGASLFWSEYHADFSMCQRVLELPHYRWDLKDYWIQYVHDWSLRKGDPPLRAPSTRLESSDIHTVVQDTLSSSGGELIVQADLSRPDLNPMVQGHKVYGVPLCTPSVYADIALTIGEYIRQVLEPSDPSTRAEIAEMTIQSALVANPHGKQQLLQTAVQLNQDDRTARCTFSSVDTNGKLIEQHAHCTIRLYDSQALLNQLQASAPGIQSRIAALQKQASGSGNTYRFSKSMIYKMVGQLADFDPNYRGLIEITMDNDALEACGVVSCRDINKKGTFHTNPACIDALSQLGGFVMNANESVDLDKEVYVNHGWRGLKLFEDIDPDTTYTTHVKMSEGADKLWTGDITVFNGDKIVAMFSGVALQNVPKRLMSYIVNTANKRVSGDQGKRLPKAQNEEPMSPKSQAPKTTTKAAAPTAASQPSNLVSSAVEIIAQESGLAISDLTDEVAFDDLGIDSLLSLVISSRLRDELELDFESSLLLELNTMGRLKSYLRDLEPAQPAASTETEIVETNGVASHCANAQNDSAENASATWKSALDIVSEESGLALQDLSGDLAFADVGIDSLLSLVICSRLRDELDIDLAERSLFMDCPTVKDLQRRITGVSDASPQSDDSSSSTSPEHSSPASPRNGTQTPDTDPENSGSVSDLAKGNMHRQDSVVGNSNAESVRPAWSIVLQGTPKKAQRKLFLFPDGCGAATSYLRLPTVSEGTSVIGFNSPYMKHPQDMHGRQLPEILASYIAAVRKHQEHGPYHLGGWSAGGILAYAVAQELMAAGETVSNLLLIDSPAPTNGLDRLPKKFFDHCTEVGIFGSEMGESAKVPAWLMPHFEATIELLHDYCAPPMPKSNTAPKASLLWAGACAFDGVKYAHLPDLNADGDGTEGMKFLTEPRTDLGPGKWSQLFPGQKINVGVVEGEHHFSMMRDKGAEQLVQWIRKELRISSLA